MWYGGDYYPEQWDAQTIAEDILLMKELHVSTVTLGVFAWTKMEPAEGEYQLDWLAEAVDLLHSNGIDVILATPTSGIPFWMAQKYPEILLVNKEGQRALGGMREKLCPNSPIYCKASGKIAEKLAERFGMHPALKLWHINNEYHYHCYCPTCAEAFRHWLKNRYATVDVLNQAWNSSFWSHTYRDFSEVLPPDYRTDIYRDAIGSRDIASLQGLDIDYKRFMTHSVRACIENEKQAIRRYSQIPVTNNFSGLTSIYDYREIAGALDVVSWDNYPTRDTPLHESAFTHDWMRSLKQKSFHVLEQSPNNITWRKYAQVKRPGEVSSIAWQGVAHGADSNLFFQWRQSRSGVEVFHGAMIPHSGRIDTRIGKELQELGRQMELLGDRLAGALPDAKVAILFDHDNWWAFESSAMFHSDLQYHKQVMKYYRALYQMGVAVDIVDEKTCMDKLYDLVIAPCFYLCSLPFAQQIGQYVEDGGTFVTTFLSGIADRNSSVYLGGYPGAFRDVLGLWVEEIDGLYPDMKNRVVLGDGTSYACGEVCDLIRLEGAEAVGLYGEDFYRDTPCITKNLLGKGAAYYVGTSPEPALLKCLLQGICGALSVDTYELPAGVELARRYQDGQSYTFLLNHTGLAQTVDLGGSYSDLLSGQYLNGTVVLQPRQNRLLLETSPEALK